MDTAKDTGKAKRMDTVKDTAAIADMAVMASTGATSMTTSAFHPMGTNIEATGALTVAIARIWTSMAHHWFHMETTTTTFPVTVTYAAAAITDRDATSIRTLAAGFPACGNVNGNRTPASGL